VCSKNINLKKGRQKENHEKEEEKENKYQRLT
jgi:hypothetical protein